MKLSFKYLNILCVHVATRIDLGNTDEMISTISDSY